MSWKRFFQEAILILLMAAAFVYASKIGMEAAVAHMDQQRAAIWAAAK